MSPGGGDGRDPAWAPDADLLLQPSVSWPAAMAVGQPHVVAVDLAMVTSAGTPSTAWPFDQEELVYTCALDGGADFDLWAVRDASVVVHRFGGTYGPAEFVVTPHEKPGDRSLWLTIVTQWGVPIITHELRVLVRPADGKGPPVEPEVIDSGLVTSVADADEPTVDLGFVGRDPVMAEATVTDVKPPVTRPETTLPDLGRGDPRRDPPGDPEAEAVGQDQVSPRPTASDDGRRQSGQGTARGPARLAEYYSVATLRRTPHGNLHIDLVPLFGPGAAPGDQVAFTARCPSSDERGTVFAVFADSSGGMDAEPRVLSVQSAKVPPGSYRVTAELVYLRPGSLRFSGLPAPLHDDPRRWEDIAAVVPRRLIRDVGPAHLIAAIEISGPPAVVRRRIERIAWLIGHVAATAEDPASYSVITYGPHSINSNSSAYPEVPVTTLAWSETATSALRTLARLARRGADPVGYPAAAQLECLLTDLSRQLTGREGRPVLVTAGGRPAHPRVLDPVSGIIPCRRRNDWRAALAELRGAHPGMGFGAIHDTRSPDELWAQLGLDVMTTSENLYVPAFAEALGLTAGPVQLLSLPLISP